MVLHAMILHIIGLLLMLKEMAYLNTGREIISENMTNCINRFKSYIMTGITIQYSATK